MRSIVPYQLLVNLYMTMTEPYFRYCEIIWGQFNHTLKNKFSETAILFQKESIYHLEKRHFQYHDQKNI